MKASNLRLCALPVVGVLFCSGCTTVQLSQSTLAQSANITALQYEMVLDNLAMFEASSSVSCSPLPWYSRIIAGDIVIKDTFNLGNPNFSYTSGTKAGKKSMSLSRSAGLTLSRNWQVDWSLSPVMDQTTLSGLSAIYSDTVNDHTNTWLHVSHSPPSGEYVGRYGHTWVSVDKADLGKLSSLTLNVIGLVQTSTANAVKSGQLPGFYLTPGPVTPIQ